MATQPCSGTLVNAFGSVNVEDTQLENRDLLLVIIEELRIMNMHLAMLTDNEITRDDLDPFHLD